MSSSDLRSRTSDSLLRLADMKYVDSRSSVLADERRPPAPGVVAASGDSTLITRAPRSPSIIAACGPASARVRSRTSRSDEGAVGHAGHATAASASGDRADVHRRRRERCRCADGWLAHDDRRRRTAWCGPTSPSTCPTLDEHQQRVVDHPGGPLLVLAGPGTGKTTTLVEAIVDRIETRGAAPDAGAGADVLAARPPSSCATGSPPGSAAPCRPR